MYRSTAATLLLGGELAGCTVGPNYARPAVEAPTVWRTTSETTASLADTSVSDSGGSARGWPRRLMRSFRSRAAAETLQATHESRRHRFPLVDVKTQALA